MTARGTTVLAVMVAFVIVLAGCTPPAKVVELHHAPRVTRDAMADVRVLPIGMRPPVGTGSIGPITGYGCAPDPDMASDAAVEQLRIKALQLQAAAVANVLILPAGATDCVGGYGALATGTAVADWGEPSSF
jgi:hypothetical protein